MRPPFIIALSDVDEEPGRYPNSDEILSYGRAIGAKAGLVRHGLHYERLPPGHRLSYPHAEEKEEEFVYVIQGTVDAWIDGSLYPMQTGELAAFPSGTGICHTFVNNSSEPVFLLAGGEKSTADNRIYYPENPQRRDEILWCQWWHDKPVSTHDADTRPPFIISADAVEETHDSYPDSDEKLSHARALGKAAGLKRIGINIQRLAPGHRTSYPHAEENEEEFVFVLRGNVDAWIDGHIFSMQQGDLAAFPAGSGICHTFINNSDNEITLLSGGTRSTADNRFYFPLHSAQKEHILWSQWWSTWPQRELGPHDGLPDARRSD